jgi:uncharacterized protein (DUF1015 family)
VPKLTPFRALRYDPAAAGRLDDLLCPPYDVINPSERERLARTDHNAVHLELPVGHPAAGDSAAGDSAAGDPYAQAAGLLASWREAGVLRLDERPMIYLLEQSYSLPHAQRDEPPRVARGFFCRLRLEEPGHGVLRHERTMSAPKEDRFRLLSATRTNLSPVLMVYRSPADRPGGELFDRLTRGEPQVEASSNGVGHRLWAADPAESPDAADLLDAAATAPLAIADGHHRYETALRYRDEVGGEGADDVLVLIYDADDGGLSVLPTHRLLHGTPDVDALSAAMAELFDAEPSDDALALERAVLGGQGLIGMWTAYGGLILRPRPDALRALLPAGSHALRGLDVTVLAVALERSLGLTNAQLGEQGRLAYTKDAGEGVAAVESGAADACFLLRGTPLDAVLDVARAGELMPPKSTYFVPKAATGLAFNLLTA